MRISIAAFALTATACAAQTYAANVPPAKVTSININGMHCGGCAAKVTATLPALAQVQTVPLVFELS